jgi:Family of unknown function (DUF6325)
MSLGPVEELVVKFPGNQFKGEIIPALHRLIDTGIVRVIDIAFVHKDANGKLTTVELDDLPPDEYAEFDPLVGSISGYFSAEDFLEQSHELENNSSAAFLLFENTWATEFRDAVLNANGEILVLERIPKAAIDELIAEQAATTMPQPDTMAQPPM